MEVKMDEERKKRRVLLQNKYEFLRPGLIQRGLMAFGFECGDGWMSILEDLFAKIDKEVKKGNLNRFKVVQVKEKFGDLVVCVEGGNNVIDALIGAALKKAAVTCEDCGKPGRKRECNGWYSTQCSKCYVVRPASEYP
jgi:hypothetical protein